MSYWSMLKSVFRECGAPKTRCTISISWADGSGVFDYPVFLPPHAVNMLQAGQVPAHVAIWKFSGPRFATGGENGVREQLCHLSCFPLGMQPAIGHSLSYKESTEEKLRRERDRLQQQMARVEQEATEARKRAEKAEKATKRLQKRTAAGTCPCCQRTFANMAEHMKHQHPEFVSETGAKVVPLKRVTGSV